MLEIRPCVVEHIAALKCLQTPRVTDICDITNSYLIVGASLASMSDARQVTIAQQLLAMGKQLSNGSLCDVPLLLTGLDPLMCNGSIPESKPVSFGDRVNSKFKSSNANRKNTDDLTDNPEDPYAFPGAPNMTSLTENALSSAVAFSASSSNGNPTDSEITLLAPQLLSRPVMCASYKTQEASESSASTPCEGGVFTNTSIINALTSPIAKLYPELAEKLERCKQKTIELNKTKGKNQSLQTMNQLQSKIAQNRIKDKLKRTRGQSTKQRSSDFKKLTPTGVTVSKQPQPRTGLPLPVYVPQKKLSLNPSLVMSSGPPIAAANVVSISTDLIGLKPTIATQHQPAAVKPCEGGAKRCSEAVVSNLHKQPTKSSRPSPVNVSSNKRSRVSRPSRSTSCKTTDASPFDAVVQCRARRSVPTPQHSRHVDRCVTTDSSRDYYTHYTQLKTRNHNLLRYDPVYCRDASDPEDYLPSQTSWFSPSSDDEPIEDDDFQDDELALHIRTTKLALLRDRLRRQATQVKQAQQRNTDTDHRYTAVALSLVHAVKDDRRSAHNTLRLLSTNCSPTPTLTRLKTGSAKERLCLHKNDAEVLCGHVALPYTNHCTKHILYNVDQQLFDYCTAKFADNTQCCVPVFDVKHELPLCAEHARKADNYAKHAPTDKRRPRKKTRPSALTRPPKKGKKKKNQRKKVLHDLTPPESPREPSNEPGSDAAESSQEYGAPKSTVEQTGRETCMNELEASLEDKTFELPENTMLGEQELHDAFSKIPDDDFDRFFTGKSSGFEMSNEEWERALAGVSASALGRDDHEYLAKQIVASGLLDNAEFMRGLNDNDMIAGLSHEHINALASGLENNLLDSTCITQAGHELLYSPSPQTYLTDSPTKTLVQSNNPRKSFTPDVVPRSSTDTRKNFSGEDSSKPFVQGALPGYLPDGGIKCVKLEKPFAHDIESNSFSGIGANKATVKDTLSMTLARDTLPSYIPDGVHTRMKQEQTFTHDIAPNTFTQPSSNKTYAKSNFPKSLSQETSHSYILEGVRKHIKQENSFVHEITSSIAATTSTNAFTSAFINGGYHIPSLQERDFKKEKPDRLSKVFLQVSPHVTTPEVVSKTCTAGKNFTKLGFLEGNFNHISQFSSMKSNRSDGQIKHVACDNRLETYSNQNNLIKHPGVDSNAVSVPSAPSLPSTAIKITSNSASTPVTLLTYPKDLHHFTLDQINALIASSPLSATPVLLTGTETLSCVSTAGAASASSVSTSLSAANPQLALSLQRPVPRASRNPLHVDAPVISDGKLKAGAGAALFQKCNQATANHHAMSVAATNQLVIPHSVSHSRLISVLNLRNVHPPSTLPPDLLSNSVRLNLPNNKPSTSIAAQFNHALTKSSPHIGSTFSTGPLNSVVVTSPSVSPHIKSVILNSAPLSSAVISGGKITSQRQSTTLNNKINSILLSATNATASPPHIRDKNDSMNYNVFAKMITPDSAVNAGPHMASKLVATGDKAPNANAKSRQHFDNNSTTSISVTVNPSLGAARDIAISHANDQRKKPANQIVSPILLQNAAPNFAFLSPGGAQTLSSIVLPVGYQAQNYRANAVHHAQAKKPPRSRSKIKATVRAQTHVTVPPTQTYYVTVPSSSSVTSLSSNKQHTPKQT